MAKNYASKLIKIAKAEVGYLEKATNSQLDSKTANAGFNDWNKYARDLDTKYPTFLNGPKNGGKGFWWCAIFVIWCFVKAFGEETAHKLLGQPLKSLGASCTACVNYYKQAGRWHDRTDKPKVGDQIIFQSKGGSPCHTGIVYKVDNNYVYTIEGNTSSADGIVANGGCVAMKKYLLTSNYIYGYGRPKYDTEPKTNKKYGFTKNKKVEFIKSKRLYYTNGKRVKFSDVKKTWKWKKICKSDAVGYTNILKGSKATLIDVKKVDNKIYGIFKHDFMIVLKDENNSYAKQ